MCLNQILFDEQIALIGCNTSGNSVQIRRHRQKIAMTARLLRAYPYPHRPYDPCAGDTANRAGQSSRAAAVPSSQASHC